MFQHCCSTFFDGQMACPSCHQSIAPKHLMKVKYKKWLLEHKKYRLQEQRRLPMYLHFHLPLSRISKQIRKHDCMISQTDSFDKTEPVGVSKSVLSTFIQQLQNHITYIYKCALTNYANQTSMATIYSNFNIDEHVVFIYKHNMDATLT